jgi:hypothetical protein
MSTSALATTVLRVEKGHAGPEELAALTALLLARAAARAPEIPAGPEQSAAGWRRLERQLGFPAAHSWRS